MRLRAVALAGAGTALAAAVVGAAVSTLRSLPRAAPDAIPPGDLLAAVAALVLTGCTAWLWASGMVALASVVGDADPSRRPWGVPATVHRAVLGGCGLALVGVAPASAVPTPWHELPVRGPWRAPVTAAAPQPGTEPGAGATTPGPTWVVRPGDTLWAIARATLGGDPPPPVVAARVDDLHRANRDSVDDPDLIHPDQRLRLPSA